MEVIKGIPVSPGLIIGRAFVLDDTVRFIPRRTVPVEGVPHQHERLADALGQAIADLERDRDRAASELGPEPAKIFEFHLGLMRDPTLIKHITTHIERDHVTAEYAVSEEFRKLTARFRAMGQEVFRQKANDLLDLDHRILSKLIGESADRLGRLTEPVVLVAHDITPTRAAMLDREKIIGIATDAGGLGKRLVERIGQCVMTCPTTACFNGLDADDSVVVGGQVRYFGDGYQIAKRIDGRRFWRIPVMDGEFLVEDRFAVQPGVGGGNLIILGKDAPAALGAARAAVKAMRQVPGIILPFPDGIVRSGSKVGSRYKGLVASTNDAYCPTLGGIAPATELPPGVGCVLEIVIDGLDLESVEEATRRGLHAAARRGIKRITAGNYGGKLGKYHIGLHGVLNG